MFVHSFNDSLVTDDDCCEERGGFSQCTPVPSGLHGIVNFSHRKFESTSDSPLISAAHRTYLQPVQQSSIHPSIKCNPILLQCTYHIQIPVLCFPSSSSWAPMEEKEEEETAAAPGNHKWWRKKELRERADKRSGEMGCVLLCGVCLGDADDSIRKRRAIPQNASE